MKILSPQEVRDLTTSGTSVTLVDVQMQDAYRHRHIPGAVHMEPSATCDHDCALLLRDKDAAIVVYGAYDELGNGALVGNALENAGYTNVARLSGGMMGWMDAGFPVEGGEES